MRAGRRNRRIIIQQVAETQDSYGALTKVWSTYKTTMAEFIPKQGREYLNKGETISQADALFRMLYFAGVTPKMRISFDGDIYDIGSISEIGYKEGLEITGQLNDA